MALVQKRGIILVSHPIKNRLLDEKRQVSRGSCVKADHCRERRGNTKKN